MDCDEYGCSRDVETYYQVVSGYEYDCSKECHDTERSTCDCSDYYDNKKGTCSKKYNDIYESGKYCFADNVIYYWKGKRYHKGSIRTYSYLNDCVTKYEECTRKDCGIVDDNGNRLCISNIDKCPINYISDEKLDGNFDYSTLELGGKTFYVHRGSNNKNTKIISGLVVDSDLYLNKDNNKKDIIDTDTISGLLKHNQNLYKGINLGYDPYSLTDIDEKGKSYLRAYYNDNNVDLVALKKADYLYNSFIDYDDEQIKPIHDDVLISVKMGYSNYCFLIIYLVLCLIIRYKKICCQQLLPCTFIIFLMSISLLILPLLCSFKNIKRLEEIDDAEIKAEFDGFSDINELYIIFNFVLILFFIIFMILVHKLDKLNFENK